MVIPETCKDQLNHRLQKISLAEAELKLFVQGLAAGLGITGEFEFDAEKSTITPTENGKNQKPKKGVEE